jgi:hypothetical protein
MSDHIAMFARDQALRERMGLRNVKAIQDHYSMTAVAEEVGNLYYDLT